MEVEVEESSGRVEPTKVADRLKGYTVADMDIHEISLLKDYSTFAEYLDQPWRRQFTYIMEAKEPLTQTVGGSVPYDINPEPVADTIYGFNEDINPYSPEGIKAYMDFTHTDYIMLHGHQSLFFGDVPEQTFSAELYSAYNQYLIDHWLDEDEGFTAGVRVNADAPRRAAEEIDRFADHDSMIAVHLEATTVELLGSRKYEPIYEAASRNGLPILFHPGGPTRAWKQDFGGPLPTTTLTWVSNISQIFMSHVANIIFQGIPEKYPDLTFVPLEHGLAWIPWLRGQMDRNYELRKDDLPWLEKRPSEYHTEHFFHGTQPIEDPAGADDMRKIFDQIDAKEMLLYTSDFPHYDFDYPAHSLIPKLSEEEERAIFGENAMKVFDL